MCVLFQQIDKLEKERGSKRSMRLIITTEYLQNPSFAEINVLYIHLLRVMSVRTLSYQIKELSVIMEKDAANARKDHEKNSYTTCAGRQAACLYTY